MDVDRDQTSPSRSSPASIIGLPHIRDAFVSYVRLLWERACSSTPASPTSSSRDQQVWDSLAGAEQWDLLQSYYLFRVFPPFTTKTTERADGVYYCDFMEYAARFVDNYANASFEECDVMPPNLQHGSDESRAMNEEVNRLRSLHGFAAVRCAALDITAGQQDSDSLLQDYSSYQIDPTMRSRTPESLLDDKAASRAIDNVLEELPSERRFVVDRMKDQWQRAAAAGRIREEMFLAKLLAFKNKAEMARVE